MARQHDAEKRLSGSVANALRAIHRRFRHALPHHPAWGPRHDAEPANRAAVVSAISVTGEKLGAVSAYTCASTKFYFAVVRRRQGYAAAPRRSVCEED